MRRYWVVISQDGWESLFKDQGAAERWVTKCTGAMLVPLVPEHPELIDAPLTNIALAALLPVMLPTDR